MKVDWQRTGKIVRLSEEFAYIQVNDREDPYPMHITNPKEYRIGDTVLCRESIQKIGDLDV